MIQEKAYFFDMDGVLFDSMPRHAIAWEEVMRQHGLPFTAYDCYVNEGRTGESVIREAFQKVLPKFQQGKVIKVIGSPSTNLFNNVVSLQFQAEVNLMF